MNFINDNEILNAHRYLEANQAPQMGLFLHQLTVLDVVSPHLRPPVAYNYYCCVSVLSKQCEDRPSNSATEWWDLHMRIR